MANEARASGGARSHSHFLSSSLHKEQLYLTGLTAQRHPRTNPALSNILRALERPDQSRCGTLVLRDIHIPLLHLKTASEHKQRHQFADTARLLRQQTKTKTYQL